jgi:predicted RND superfamily exporter protein
MTDLGIKVYRLRKQLQKVIEDLPQDLPAGTSMEQPEKQFDSNADSLVQSVLLKVRDNLLDPDEAYDEILSMRNEEEETHLNISVASWSLVVRLPTSEKGLRFSVVNTELPGALQAWFNAGENEEESVKLRNILLRKGLVLRMGPEETDLGEAVRVWNQRNENLGIIVDEEVEEEVEGSSKWTDRALMLQSGLLTAVEVEECEDGSFIRRIRAR